MKLIKSGKIHRSKLHHKKKFKERTPRPIQKDFDQMYDDIEQKGQLRPVAIDEDWNIVDGYTRDEILGKQRIDEIKFNQYEFEDDQEKLEYVDSMNVKRRHLGKWQRFEASLDTYEKEKVEAQKRQEKGTLQSQDVKGTAIEKAAKQADMSPKTYERALDVKNSEEFPKYQKDLLSGEKKIKTVHTLVTRKQRNLPKAKMPKGEFDVILADVPYEHDDQGGRFSASAQFETMSVEEIAKLKIPASENAICYFFMSPSIMYDVVPKEYKVGNKSIMINVPIYKYILDTWGFTVVKAEDVWDKEIIGGGSYNRNQHENILIAIKGKMPVPAEIFSSVIKERRKPRSHSKKPEAIYDIIEKNYPERKYLELFARHKHSEKWTVFGNQIKEKSQNG